MPPSPNRHLNAEQKKEWFRVIRKSLEDAGMKKNI